MPYIFKCEGRDCGRTRDSDDTEICSECGKECLECCYQFWTTCPNCKKTFCEECISPRKTTENCSKCVTCNICKKKFKEKYLNNCCECGNEVCRTCSTICQKCEFQICFNCIHDCPEKYRCHICKTILKGDNFDMYCCEECENEVCHACSTTCQKCDYPTCFNCTHDCSEK